MSTDEEKKKFVVVISPEKYRVLPSDIYKAKLIELSEDVGKWGDVFVVTFLIVEGKCNGCKTNGMINKSSHGAKGKLWSLIHALSGSKLEVLDSFCIQELVGNQCYINVEQKGGNNAITEYVHPKDF